MVSPALWRGRRVFVTGHTGFKGAWLSVLLSDWGSKIFGYALEANPSSIFYLSQIGNILAHSQIADIRDLDALSRALAFSEAEIVFHMAAQPLVRLSYHDPVSTYSTNVMGTVHLLEACRNVSSVKAVVVITSDKCYENREWVWGYRENEPMGGRDPYSNSKGCAELVTSAYRDTFFGQSGPKIATGRAGNVIGGGDFSTDRLVPDLIRSIMAGEKAHIRNPGAIRPWQHVLEPIVGYVRLAECLMQQHGAQFAEGWNFGPDPTGDRTVQAVVEAIYRHWPDGQWQRDVASHIHEAYTLKLDSSKSRSRLGWKPRWCFEQTIQRTVEWYKSYIDRQDTLAITRQQIDDYLSINQG